MRPTLNQLRSSFEFSLGSHRCCLLFSKQSTALCGPAIYCFSLLLLKCFRDGARHTWNRTLQDHNRYSWVNHIILDGPSLQIKFIVLQRRQSMDGACSFSFPSNGAQTSNGRSSGAGGWINSNWIFFSISSHSKQRGSKAIQPLNVHTDSGCYLMLTVISMILLNNTCAG